MDVSAERGCSEAPTTENNVLPSTALQELAVTFEPAGAILPQLARPRCIVVDSGRVPAPLPACVRTVSVNDPVISPYLNSMRKRFLDVWLASLLILLTAPILVLATIAIRATSRGPALFRQLRGGKKGAPFTILKFRSMFDEACNGVLSQAKRNDPRVTWVGRFIRRTSIDELPQLFNVLKGEMSLVGPRPHALLHDQYYADLIPVYARRSLATPGLTGLAQVKGARGATLRIEEMERRVALDLDYISKASLLVDLRLILATGREMLGSVTAV